VTGLDAANIPQPQVADTSGQRPFGAPVEARLPAGRSLHTVQTQPLPLISHPEGPRPVHDEQMVRQQVAQARVEHTGSGAIVDTIV